jgi:hypothetical protein
MRHRSRLSQAAGRVCADRMISERPHGRSHCQVVISAITVCRQQLRANNKGAPGNNCPPNFEFNYNYIFRTGVNVILLLGM